MNRCLSFTIVAVATAGCVGHAGTNPSFDVTAPQARQAMREMAASPKPLARPVIVLDGMGPPLASRVTGVQFAFCFSLDDCRRRVIETVERLYPSADPDWTSEVDVIGVSMGGVVARCAAAPPEVRRAGKRLRVARLFTISSPHRGAVIASRLPPLIGPIQVELRQDSSFLRSLGQREDLASYELVPYVRLGDVIVGDANAAPENQLPHWLSTPPLEDAHLTAFADPRIVADIARRLRGEAPFAMDPRAPLPG